MIHEIETMMLGLDTVILTENADGELYLIRVKYLQDCLIDWKDKCKFVPCNDAKVFFASWNGQPINPHHYTDFESLLRLFENMLKGEYKV